MQNIFFIQKNRLFLILSVLFLVACNTPEIPPVAKVTLIKAIPNFSSGSGMELLNNTLYAVGDDDAYIWKLTTEGEEINHWRIWDTAEIVNNRIPKAIKPDFEAVSWYPIENDSALLIFSSGSKPSRTYIIEAHLSAHPIAFRKNGAKLFDWIKADGNLSEKEINIEGAAFWNAQLLLLNRARNELYLIPKTQFDVFLNINTTSQLTKQTFAYTLPKIDGTEARFSGAAVYKDFLIFSASVEHNSDNYHDGAIGGSFIGIINLTTLELIKVYPIVYNNEILKVKLEAINLIRFDNQNITLAGITDDDDGTTSFLHIVLENILD